MLTDCPLCYLPRIEFGSPYYYQPPPPVAETPVITQAVQPVQQVQYVYKQPIVKFIISLASNLLPFLDTSNRWSMSICRMEELAGEDTRQGMVWSITLLDKEIHPGHLGNSGYNSAQPPHQPYKMSQQYLASRGYSTGWVQPVSRGEKGPETILNWFQIAYINQVCHPDGP